MSKPRRPKPAAPARAAQGAKAAAPGLSKAEAEWAIADIIQRLVFGMHPASIEPEVLGLIASAVTNEQLHALARRVVLKLARDKRVDGLRESVSAEPMRFIEVETKWGRALCPDPSQLRPVDIDKRFDEAVRALSSAVASRRASQPRAGDAKALAEALRRCFPGKGATEAIRALSQDPETVADKLRDRGGLPGAPAIDDIEVEGIVSAPGKPIGGVVVVQVPPGRDRKIMVSAIRDAYSRPRRKNQAKSKV